MLFGFRDHDKLWGIPIDDAAREIPISRDKFLSFDVSSSASVGIGG